MARLDGQMRRLQAVLISSVLLASAHIHIMCTAFDGASARYTPNTKVRSRPRRLQLPLVRKDSLLYSSKNDDSDGWNLFKRRPSLDALQTPSREKSQYQQDNTKEIERSYITREMERDVMASARATVDGKTISRAVSSLVADNENENRPDDGNSRGSNLRNLASGIQPNSSPSNRKLDISYQDSTSSSSWDTQQIALASGVTTCLLSPIVVPIVHSLIPPILPFPSSISFEGAAFLGTLAYIVALGDPTDQSNVISKTTSGSVLQDGVEVTGAVSRIVGRTALQSAKASAPRLKAVARAVVDYDSNVNTMEEMKEMQYQLSRRLLELESENDSLRREIALWNAVKDVSGAYKLEELKEIARVNGIRGYSTDGKTALLRRLLNERALNLDLTPYYQSSDDMF
eukprot:scaffold1796_cov60-Cyclotella_meneghiniana.AAC.10